MKTMKKSLAVVLALVLGIMLVVPALAVEPRIRKTPCACGGMISTFEVKGQGTETPDGKMKYEVKVYSKCDTCTYENNYTYTIVE